jgi:hypothetical protein
MDIDDLLGKPLPQRSDYRLGDADEVSHTGDVRRVPLYFGDEVVTEVSGITGDDMLRAAKHAAEEHERGRE